MPLGNSMSGQVVRSVHRHCMATQTRRMQMIQTTCDQSQSDRRQAQQRDAQSRFEDFPKSRFVWFVVNRAIFGNASIQEGQRSCRDFPGVSRSQAMPSAGRDLSSILHVPKSSPTERKPGSIASVRLDRSPCRKSTREGQQPCKPSSRSVSFFASRH